MLCVQELRTPCSALSLTTDRAYLMDLDLTHYCSMLLDPFLAVDLVQTFHLTDEFCIFILKPDSRHSSTIFFLEYEPHSLSLRIHVPSTLLKPLHSEVAFFL